LLIAVLIFLVALVVAADRVGALVGAHVLAGKLQDYEHLDNRPSVSIGGVPFLTQAFGGKYDDVKVTASGVRVAGDVPVTTLTAHLHGVHLPLSKVIGGSVSRVPVDRIDGTVFVSFTDANTYLTHHSPAGQLVRLALGPGGALAVLDRMTTAGRRVDLRGAASITQAGNVLTLNVNKLSGAANRVTSAVLGRLSVVLPLRALPFRLELTSVTATSTGITAVGAVREVVLGSGH
jgi:hypothetical protein